VGSEAKNTSIVDPVAAAEARDWLARRGRKGIPHDEAMRRLGLE
jgi:hypothetical protein